MLRKASPAMSAALGKACLLGALGIAFLQLPADGGLAGGASRGQDGPPSQLLVRFAPGLSERARSDLRAHHNVAAIASIPQLGVELISPSSACDTSALLVALRACDSVDWVEPNAFCQVALAEPNDPAYHAQIDGHWVQWPAHELAVLSAWATYPGGFFTALDRPQQAPIVAIIDTGVDPAHPDFMNAGATGTDITAGGQLMLSAARTFLAGRSADLAPDATDEHGHGTHLAGLVAAAVNNGMTAGDGMVGIGYPARLLPLKVTSANGISGHADVARAIVYAADQSASIILLGMATPAWSETLQAAVDYAWHRGSFLVAPAGNWGDSTPMFPAACPHVFGVAAATASGERAAYSSWGDHVALAAPGGDAEAPVYSTLPTYACTLRTDLTTPAYGLLYGTSQAAAHVTAAATLYAGATGSTPRTHEQASLLWQALQSSATTMGTDPSGGWDARHGYGLVAPARLVSGGLADDPIAGGLVGRVLLDGAPAIGASITATPEGLGEEIAVTSVWPAGSYRITHLSPGFYRVSAEADGCVGVWEQVTVMPGCDLPGVDFSLGSPAPGAALVTSTFPASAVCGGLVEIGIAFQNSGASTWSRAAGYALALVPAEDQLCAEPDRASLPPDRMIAPGETAAFALSVSAPDEWGIYNTAWRMRQDGGAGWFGPVAGGAIGVTSFRDVPIDHWAVASVEAAKTAGVVQGYGDDMYQPGWPVSRDQMAVYIARAAGWVELGDDMTAAPGLFGDVPAGFWAGSAIQACVANGVAEGYPDGLYHPFDGVDRAQMAVFIARAIAVPTGEAGLETYSPPLTPTFEDVPNTGCGPDGAQPFWAYSHVEYCAEKGVVKGYLDGLYHPDDAVTRDQMAVYIARAFRLPA